MHKNRAPATLRRADYGIDAPDVVRRFFLVAALCIGLGLLFAFSTSLRLPAALARYVPALVSICGSFLATAGLMLWGSRVGKIRLRDKALRQVDWRGDEEVLDVGCGHGLMLIGAAKRLREG